jgi:hypothetical protein
VRHVRTRILGIGLLVALFAGAFGASSALAAKDPYSVNTWGQYKDCPYENPEIEECFYGRTNGGAEGGEFQYGHIRVLLSKPIVIQGGAKFNENNEQEVKPAVNGGETLESPELKVVKGLNVITPKVQTEAEWPTALKESFNAAKKAKETQAFVKIEMAGNECFEVPGCLNTEAIVNEEGIAFRLSLKVKVTSPWLEKLGGGPCYIGSDEHPIKQNLTTETAGNFGEGIEFNAPEYNNVEIFNSELVDTHWHIEPASGPNGCGGPEYESYIDGALGNLLEINRADKTGITWLKGNLHDANSHKVNEEHEAGNPELP